MIWCIEMANSQILQTRNKPRRHVVRYMDGQNCIRTYRESPESIQFQIRLVNQYVTVSLQFEEAEQLAAKILDARWSVVT